MCMSAVAQSGDQSGQALTGTASCGAWTQFQAGGTQLARLKDPRSGCKWCRSALLGKIIMQGITRSTDTCCMHEMQEAAVPVRHL